MERVVEVEDMKQRSLGINALLNIVRQGMAIIFPFITFPYVSRVLGIIEFGRYNFSVSVVSYFALLAAFGIANFAVREGARIREDRNKFSIFASELFTFSLITTAVAFILLLLTILYSTKLHSYTVLIFVQSLSIVLTTMGMDWINTVYEDYLYITVRHIIIQCLAMAMIFIFVKSSSDTVIYASILLFGSYGGNIVNLIYIRKYVDIRLNWKIPYHKILPPLFILFINSLAVIIYVNSDITVLGMFETDESVGIYSFSAKIYNILKYVINAAIIVVVPRLASIYSKDIEVYVVKLREIFNLLTIFLVPIAVGMVMLSDSIILLAGGSSYLQGDVSLKVLSFSLIFALLSSVYVNGMLIISRQERRTMLGTILSATINVIGNFILIPLIGMLGAAITTVLSEGVNFFLQRYFSKKYVLNAHFIDRFSIICTLLGGGITLFVCYFMNTFFIGTSITVALIRIILAFTLSSCLYFIVLWLLKYDLLIKYFRRSL